MELGTVASTADPMGLGRVQVIVPGIIDQPGPWALPIGTVGGGGPQRGFFAVPPKGSDVAVWFHRGDPERPYYQSGHWGDAKAGVELPDDVTKTDATKRPDVAAFQTKNWQMTFDDTDDKSALRINHKTMDLRLEIDAIKGVVEISGESALNLKSGGLLNIDGLHVIIAGRTVLQNGKPIS